MPRRARENHFGPNRARLAEATKTPAQHMRGSEEAAYPNAGLLGAAADSCFHREQAFPLPNRDDLSITPPGDPEDRLVQGVPIHQGDVIGRVAQKFAGGLVPLLWSDDYHRDVVGPAGEEQVSRLEV